MTKSTRLLLPTALMCLSQWALADIAYLAVSDGYWQVWTMRDNGGNPKQLTHSEYDKSRISWFPDGKRILINGNDGQIRVVQIENGSEEAVNLSLSGMLDAVVSPNGLQVAFSLSTSGSIDDNNIWTVGIDGANLRKQTRLTNMQHEPAWSWSGNFIYFSSGDGGQAHDIWQLTLATEKVEQLTVGSLYHFDVASGPDGQLAFSSNRSGNYEIWAGDVDQSSPPVKLTNNPALDARPSWSPTGEFITFESSRSGGLNIWLIDVASREIIQLTDHDGGARHPVWSRSRASNPEATP